MTARSEEVRGLFLAAVEVAEDARGAFLAAACSDREIRAEVTRMLEHDALASASDFLAEPALGPALRPGEEVGGYGVVRLLGEGGMGEVYLVEQRATGQHFALKLMRLGLDSRRVLARFEVERQVLARMDHDGIARVVDAGRTERGQPFFVMEYVDGVPIDGYVERQRCSLRERIQLFVRVCEAVQHAHQQGAIHRDLKPGNVLVTEREGGPVPKIIDFGLARATDERAVPGLTEHGQVLGTPEFMSPEQVDGAVGAIDTRADVYSLGAILYLLLAGARPLERLRDDGDERMRRRIRDEMPIRPSAHAATPQDARALRGELDWVTLKALQKERDARYQAVGELADDLRRYLAGEPVSARPISSLYLLRKLIGRHRALVAMAAVAVLAVTGGLVGTAIGFVEADSARREAERALSDFRKLGVGVQLDRAIVEEARLYPAWPHMLPEMRQWIDEHAAPLLAAQSDMARALDEVRSRALPYDEAARARQHERYADERAEVARLERVRGSLRSGGGASDEIAELERRIQELRQLVEVQGAYTFVHESDHLVHDGLARLMGELKDFGDPETGLVAAVEERIAWAEQIERLTIEAPRAAWDRARSEVAADPRTAEMALTPQRGLVPLGADPVTGLQEFAHLRSGRPAARRADGRLAFDEAAGLVFVLVPGRAVVLDGETEIRIAPFLVSKFEVTQGQWMRLAGRNPSVHQPASGVGETFAHAVENVSWEECTRLLAQHALALPTEVQWELVSTPADKALSLARRGARADAGPPNAFGLVFMHGNVGEWCRDGHDERRLAARAGDGLRELARTHHRVVRGPRRFLRADSRSDTVGVRPVRRIVP